jgi:ABC-type lipoprotein release transport system permease subunit
MTTISKRLEMSYPASNREVGVRVVPLMDETIQPVRPALYVVDPLCFVAAPLLLVSVALVDSYWPARRAASVDPAITLRGE